MHINCWCIASLAGIARTLHDATTGASELSPPHLWEVPMTFKAQNVAGMQVMFAAGSGVCCVAALLQRGADQLGRTVSRLKKKLWICKSISHVYGTA